VRVRCASSAHVDHARLHHDDRRWTQQDELFAPIWTFLTAASGGTCCQRYLARTRVLGIAGRRCPTRHKRWSSGVRLIASYHLTQSKCELQKLWICGSEHCASIPPRRHWGHSIRSSWAKVQNPEPRFHNELRLILSEELLCSLGAARDELQNSRHAGNLRGPPFPRSVPCGTAALLDRAHRSPDGLNRLHGLRAHQLAPQHR
jgi:hypothetical protein